MNLTKSFFPTLLVLFSIHLQAQPEPQYFSNDAVTADLDYLYKALKEAHINPYAYVTEEELAAVYARVKASVQQDSLDLLQATGMLQQLISAVNNGHTEIDFPGSSYIQYAYNGGTLFPLEIAFEDGKALVRKNYSENDAITPGTEIVSIDGKPVDEILTRIYPHVSAEREYFKNARIEMYSFPRFYWQVFGKIDQFDVEIESADGIKRYSLPAIDLIEGYESRRTEILDPGMQLKFYGSSVYLNPGPFGGDETKYRQFIDSAFHVIRNHNPEYLIIDLRNNSGGNDSFSDYLVSHIADRPFQWSSRFSMKSSKLLKENIRQNSDTTTAFSREILRRKDGEVFDYAFDNYQPQPSAKRFQGDVYALVNRQSHSQSAVTAAQLQDYGFATIVGEETGEYPTLYASQFQFQLPNTGITVKMSKGYIVRVNGSTKEEGVIPDIMIRDHLLDEKDEILEGLLERLE